MFDAIVEKITKVEGPCYLKAKSRKTPLEKLAYVEKATYYQSEIIDYASNERVSFTRNPFCSLTFPSRAAAINFCSETFSCGIPSQIPYFKIEICPYREKLYVLFMRGANGNVGHIVQHNSLRDRFFITEKAAQKYLDKQKAKPYHDRGWDRVEVRCVTKDDYTSSGYRWLF